jgi:PPIC-type PPIASE domain
MRRLIREPLLHFLILGAALFALYGWLNRDGFKGPNEIVVSRGQSAALKSQFERVWQRPPTEQELAALIDNWVREEIFYREALAMGLDRDDPVVRRRMQQKVEFVLDSAIPEAPTTEEMQKWLDAHEDTYRIDGQYTLSQVYFDPARHGDKLQADMIAALRTLNAGHEVRGDVATLPEQLNADGADISRTFGRQFEEALRQLPTGSWQGPVRSGFGLHLVKLNERVLPRTAKLEEVRAAVERDLMHQRTQESDEAFYKRLQANYRVRIEADTATSTGGS